MHHTGVGREEVPSRAPVAAERVSATCACGKPLEYRIDIWDIAHTILEGHRLRITISSSDTPNHEPLTEPAINNVLHSADYPSKLLVTVR